MGAKEQIFSTGTFTIDSHIVHWDTDTTRQHGNYTLQDDQTTKNNIETTAMIQWQPDNNKETTRRQQQKQQQVNKTTSMRQQQQIPSNVSNIASI